MAKGVAFTDQAKADLRVIRSPATDSVESERAAREGQRLRAFTKTSVLQSEMMTKPGMR